MTDDLISRKAALDGMMKYGFIAPDMTAHEFVEDELPSVPAVPLDKLCECLVRKRIGFVDEVDGKRLTGELTKGAWATLIGEWMEELDDGKEPAQGGITRRG